MSTAQTAMEKAPAQAMEDKQLKASPKAGETGWRWTETGDNRKE